MNNLEEAQANAELAFQAWATAQQLAEVLGAIPLARLHQTNSVELRALCVLTQRALETAKRVHATKATFE